MHCHCDELPEYTYYDEIRGISQKLIPFLAKLTECNWRELHVCTICETYWRIDSPDKFRPRYVWKVGLFRGDWSDIEFIDEEKRLLAQCRGGITDEKCIRANCGKPRIKGVAYCIDHLYEMGAAVDLSRQVVISQR